LRLLGHPALLEHLAVTLQRAVEFRQIAAKHVGAEHDPLERADIALGRVRAYNSGPPEQRFEEFVILLLLDQRGAGKVKVQIGIPARNFGCPGIIRIAEVRPNDGELWKLTRNPVEQGRPHTIYAHIT